MTVPSFVPTTEPYRVLPASVSCAIRDFPVAAPEALSGRQSHHLSRVRLSLALGAQ
jgi:hypothetical protein